jgi:hypothetical protein
MRKNGSLTNDQEVNFAANVAARGAGRSLLDESNQYKMTTSTNSKPQSSAQQR